MGIESKKKVAYQMGLGIKPPPEFCVSLCSTGDISGQWVQIQMMQAQQNYRPYEPPVEVPVKVEEPSRYAFEAPNWAKPDDSWKEKL